MRSQVAVERPTRRSEPVRRHCESGPFRTKIGGKSYDAPNSSVGKSPRAAVSLPILVINVPGSGSD